MKVTTEVSNFNIRFYIDGQLHLSFKESEYSGLHTFIDGNKGVWCVEVHLKGGIITLQYDSKAKWDAMLKSLDKWLKQDHT